MEENMPNLERKSVFEFAYIDEPVFLIGKDPNRVNYPVSNNSAVSRIHAGIITRSGRFFVKDLRSTNRTFINEVPIPPETEVEIFDGDELMFANERFIFHTV